MAEDVFTVYLENKQLLLLLDRDHDPRHWANTFLLRTNLPPGGNSAGLYNFLLRRAPDSSCAGLASVYLGYPTPRTAYIGELFLRPLAQGQGLGSELRAALETILRARGMTNVRVGVGLRNWNALRFWIRGGYVHITGMSGSRIFAPHNFAFLELQKSLKTPTAPHFPQPDSNDFSPGGKKRHTIS